MTIFSYRASRFTKDGQSYRRPFIYVRLGDQHLVGPALVRVAEGRPSAGDGPRNIICDLVLRLYFKKNQGHRRSRSPKPSISSLRACVPALLLRLLVLLLRP